MQYVSSCFYHDKDILQGVKHITITRYVQLNPVTWNDWICVRWEVYGCSLDAIC